ncbi:hypothetical protein BN1110_06130 [bacterium YEK0313]|nr:hypothetical protein BN1110_06130 [bacterium YEK0313]
MLNRSFNARAGRRRRDPPRDKAPVGQNGMGNVEIFPNQDHGHAQGLPLAGHPISRRTKCRSPAGWNRPCVTRHVMLD